MGTSPAKRGGSPPPVDRVAVGIIRKAHGVRGEASVESWSDDPDRFDTLSRVFLVSPDEQTSRAVTVASWRPHGERLLVRFEEVATPEEIRTLQEWTIEIPAAEARALEEDEYFLHDLVGLELYDVPTQRVAGVVDRVAEGGGGVLLHIKAPDGHRFDVPFAAAICTKVDLEAKRIEAELPVGLDDLASVEAVEQAEEPAEEEPAPAEAPSGPGLRIDLVTIFPRMFDPLLSEGIIARGIRAGALEVKVWDLRDFATDKHKSTDDEAYGGGAGMVMLAAPVLRCVDAIRASGEGQPHVVMMTPQGRTFTQTVAAELSGRKWLVLLCGRYEGFDERVREAVVDEELSVGDFVVAGGEVPAMLVTEAVGRLVPGVVGDRDSVEADSFYAGLLDYPHYTRPADLDGRKVPEVLLSGHFENIRKWRKEQALRATLRKRPDLLETAPLDDEAKKILGRIRGEEEAARASSSATTEAGTAPPEENRGDRGSR